MTVLVFREKKRAYVAPFLWCGMLGDPEVPILRVLRRQVFFQHE
jgi:hypothetical protein